jgi:flagella basal body P-ring formation protein FlgA
MKFGRTVLVIAMTLAGVARAEERYVPLSSPRGTLEVRGEATIVGPEVKLRQVCRWGEADEAAFGGAGELVVARITQQGVQAIELNELKAALHDAGVNLATIRFAGNVTCNVTRSDAGQPGDQAGLATAVSVRKLTPTTSAATTQQADGGVMTLRERLTRDVAERLALPIETVQVAFAAGDEKLLSLPEPQFRFNIDPRRVRNLGSVSWEVTIEAEGAKGVKPQKAVITAMARAWQNQLVVNKPVAGRQTIREDDVIERRALVDKLEDGQLLTRGQVVGQQAVLDMKPGTVLTARTVEATPLARVGQLVTVTINSGGVHIRTVARAMDAGTFGQSIRVRNETTKDVYEVILTGPGLGSMNGSNNG